MNKILLTITILGLALLSCTNVKLQALRGQQMESASGSFFSTLKPPEDVQTQLRVLFFVDQSYSMIHGKCQTDLDGSRPLGSSTGCANPAPGIDPEGNRFEVLKKWIQELKQSAPTAKVAVFPFSGGMSERPRKFPYNNTPIHDGAELYKFLSLDQATGRVGDLVNEQQNDLLKDTKIDNGNFVGSAPTYMGTTVPLSTLQYARDRIFEEMDALQKSGQLHNTKFRFIYLSDGVFIPTDDIIDKALGLAGRQCSKKCMQDPRVVTCDNGWVAMNGRGWSQLTEQEKKAWPAECGYPGPSGYVDDCFCLNIGNDMYQAFGDPAHNKLSRLLDVLDQIKALPKYFGEGVVRMDFVRLQPNRVQPEDVQNIFDEMQKRHGDSTESALVDNVPPFSIIGATPNQLTYQLESFYVVNLNAIVGEGGALVVDSDGDGLSDADEVRLGTDPHDPRTPDKDGKRWCLDGIEQQFNCKKTSCSPDVDSDNDGLNECEELTLQTTPFARTTALTGFLIISR